MDEIAPVVIPLKKKYLRAVKTRYPINGDHQGHNKRHKIGKAAHDKRFGEARPKTKVIKKSGGAVMVYTDELEKRQS